MQRWLVVTCALVALVVAGLGAWMVFGGSGAATTSPQAKATTLAPSGAASSAGSPTASGNPAPSTSPTPHPTLIALPRGIGHFRAAPAPTMIRGPRNLSVPILMYHLIGTPPAGEPYPDLFVSRHDFVQQMRYLEANGFTAVTLSQVNAFWHGRARLPAKPVVLTFDDGYRSDWVVAAPILQRIGWPGVLNLCMNAVRPHGDLPVPLVHGLVRAGWEVDDHTLTHPDLTTLDAAGLHREIVVSRAVLQALTGEKVSFFCYPSGAYDAIVIAAVKAAGFKGATTTNEGLATPAERFTLARIRVHRTMDLATFAQALAR